MRESKNDTAWNKLFIERPILEDIHKQGFHRLTAQDINQFREARLMTKFDFYTNLPKIFQKNNLSILPDSRRSYVISDFDCYAQIPNKVAIPEGRSLPDWIASLEPTNLYSESAALLCAYHAGMLHEVLEQEDDLAFTVFGRMSTGKFDCYVERRNRDSYPFGVDRAQCEIDGGFETPEVFALIEVKNETIDNFNIRQLYYPYRLWTNKLSKKIVPILMTYSNEVFRFFVYEFVDDSVFNSINLVKQVAFQIAPNELNIEDIRRILSEAVIRDEPEGVPFPQADSMPRAIDLLNQLYLSQELTQDKITTNYAFSVRQTQYYTDSVRYLGLVSKNNDVYTLTAEGEALVLQVPQRRNQILVEKILSQRVFNLTMRLYFENAELPSKDDIAIIVHKVRPKLTGETLTRRAQTVRSWLSWIIDLTKT